MMFSSNLSKKGFNDTLTADGQSLLSMRFPQKLWKIVNECKTGAIQWSRDGKSIVLDYSKFQTQYLDNQLDVFKTSNITSFVRQLNLYGFRKISHHTHHSLVSMQNADIHEFRNDYFIRDRSDLLQKVSRKTGVIKTRISYRNSPVCKSSAFTGTTRIARCQMALQDALNKQVVLSHAETSRSSIAASLAAQNKGQKLEWLNYNEFKPENKHWGPHATSNISSIRQSEETAHSKRFRYSHGLWDKSKKYIDHGLLSTTATAYTQNLPSTSSDINQLLDPTTSPKIYHHGDGDASSLEETFSIDSVLSHMDKNLSENLYNMIADDASKDNKLGLHAELFINYQGEKNPIQPESTFPNPYVSVEYSDIGNRTAFQSAGRNNQQIHQCQNLGMHSVQENQSYENVGEMVLPDDGVTYNYGMYDLPNPFHNYQ